MDIAPLELLFSGQKPHIIGLPSYVHYLCTLDWAPLPDLKIQRTWLKPSYEATACRQLKRVSAPIGV